MAARVLLFWKVYAIIKEEIFCDENRLHEASASCDRKEGFCMKQAADLKQMLRSINGKSYGAYKSLAGAYAFGTYTLWIDHVQGDPFAAPSKVRIVVNAKDHGFPAELFDTYEKKTALEDYLIRQFTYRLGRYSGKRQGQAAADESTSAAADRKY